MILSLISGILLAFAFPKFNLWWLAWVAIVPFFYTLNQAKNWRQALLYGLFFGIPFFGINLFWVNSLFRFAGWWVFLGWGSLVLFQTLFVLLFAFLAKGEGRGAGQGQRVLIPILWVFVEWLRALGPFGVTVGDVGYSQVQLLPLIQIASFASVYGVSFLVVLVNATIVTIFMEPATKPACRQARRRGSIIFILVLLIAVYIFGSFELRGSREIYSQASSPLKLALIQPNIDQMVKMDLNKAQTVFAVHEELTRKAALEKPDIIVWPETAIFSYLLRDPILFPRLKQLAIETKAWLVIGTPYYDTQGKIYNSIVSISPSGEVVSRYDKQHLVPFGEYLPFRSLLYPLLRGVGYYSQDFDSNPKVELLTVGKEKVAAAICFESTFPAMKVKKEAGFILTVTNDGWFGNSSAPYFHFNCGVFRAIENRKHFVQVGNTGFSAVIDPYGRTLKKTELNQQAILTFEIPLP